MHCIMNKNYVHEAVLTNNYNGSIYTKPETQNFCCASSFGNGMKVFVAIYDCENDLLLLSGE